MKKFVYWLSMTFGFSTREANAFIGLLLVILLLIGATYIYPELNSSVYTSYETDKQKLDSLLLVIKSKIPEDSALNFKSTEPFDPNKINEDDWLKMGLKPWLAKRIEKYKKHGGEFRKKEDLLKIYGFSEDDYNRIKDHIIIKPELPKPKDTVIKPTKIKREEKVHFKFDINKADSVQLKKIKGIGKVLSARIVNYREKLGGYYSLKQLYEVYNLDSTTIENLYSATFVDENFKPQQIDINKASYKQLISHPYISGKQASLIINYRSQHGNYASPEELLKVKPLEKQWLKKLYPYLISASE